MGDLQPALHCKTGDQYATLTCILWSATVESLTLVNLFNMAPRQLCMLTATLPPCIVKFFNPLARGGERGGRKCVACSPWCYAVDSSPVMRRRIGGAPGHSSGPLIQLVGHRQPDACGIVRNSRSRVQAQRVHKFIAAFSQLDLFVQKLVCSLKKK